MNNNIEEKHSQKIFIPDNKSIDIALKRTTQLCFAAHQDDTEFMAYHAIESSISNENEWFTSVIITDGGGSPRTGKYADFTDEDMKKIRITEQNTAAEIGKYSAQIQLGYPSKSVKANDKRVVEAIKQFILVCKPRVIYTHNLADKHPTHVASALRVIEALTELEASERPKQLIGLEVWRGLDWVIDKEKMVFDASAEPELAEKLMSVFDSQIVGGKRYDAAVMGRRKANATFLGDHEVDKMEYAIYGVDMTEVMHGRLSCEEFVSGLIDDFKSEVINNIKGLR